MSELLPQHAALLRGSAISDEVALARGYRSIEHKARLTELGFSVLSASNGHEALALAGRHPEVVLLITDVVMPGMNGRKLAEEALRRHPSLKVLFTTGYTRNAIVHNGVLDEGVELLPKPFSLESMSAKITKLLHTK